MYHRVGDHVAERGKVDDKVTVNSGATAKKKRRGGPGKPFVKGDKRINLNGAPKRGDSWAETIKAIGEMDGPSIAALWDTQHREFAKLPDGITMKQLVVMTVYASLLREPSPGNWRELMERAEGKVSLPVETWQDRVIALLRENKVTPEQVEDEFGADVATDLAIAAGLQLGTSGEVRAESGTDSDHRQAIG